MEKWNSWIQEQFLHVFAIVKANTVGPCLYLNIYEVQEYSHEVFRPAVTSKGTSLTTASIRHLTQLSRFEN